MSKCKDCQYAVTSDYLGDDKVCCTLTNILMRAYAAHDCDYFNFDLSEYDICYNCKYYGGGHDWGLFCSKRYHHLGNFNDLACDEFEYKGDK